jgi:hypothetical protein
MNIATELTNRSDSLPATPVDDQLRQPAHNLTIPVPSPLSISLPHDNGRTGGNSNSRNNNNTGRISVLNNNTPFTLQIEQPHTPPSQMTTSLSGQPITHSMTAATSPSSSDIIQSVLALSQMEASTTTSPMSVDAESSRLLVSPTPWHKYGLDKNAYILIRASNNLIIILLHSININQH